MKHVLITGVSTGIGYAAAQAFVRKGYHVYGSVRRQEDAEKLQRALGPRSHRYILMLLTMWRSGRGHES